MLALNILVKDRKQLESLVLAKWKNRGIRRYLGVKFSANLKDMIKDNIEDLWHKIKQLEIWTTLPISWYGRIAIIKRNVVPRFLFIFSTINLPISKKLINKIQASINKFIWSYKIPRIAETAGADERHSLLPDAQPLLRPP